MKKKIYIMLSILILIAFIAYVKDESQFTKKEYEKLYNDVVVFFENEKFDCKEEFVQEEYDEWVQNNEGDKEDKYVTPTICRVEIKENISGIVYTSEIIYNIVLYEDMLYSKKKSQSEHFTLYVESKVNPKEKFSGNRTAISLFQTTKDNFLYLHLFKDEYKNAEDAHDFIGITSQQEDDKNFAYYQEIFKNGLPDKVKNETTIDERDYFDLIVEKGYAENLLNEFKVNKDEADEIAHRFEKSEIYDKIYNLKY